MRRTCSRVISAIASGDVQIALAGSSPIAAGVSRGLDVEVIWIAEDIASAEALVVREGSGIARLQVRRLAAAAVAAEVLQGQFGVGTAASTAQRPARLAVGVVVKQHLNLDRLPAALDEQRLEARVDPEQVARAVPAAVDRADHCARGVAHIDDRGDSLEVGCRVVAQPHLHGP